MANKTLFSGRGGRDVPAVDALNEAGGTAYALEPRHALAQIAATGCLNDVFYSGGRDQLDAVLALSRDIDPEFIGRTAVFARERGYMKDMPALLLAVLSVRGPDVLPRVFDSVIDNGRMLRTFVQIMRSGAVGRTSLGSRPKRLVLDWLASRTEEQLLWASVGNDPSLADVVRMVHPRPATKHREAFYAWLLGRPHEFRDLPSIVRRYEDFKAGRSFDAPRVPFAMLTALDLTTEVWRTIAKRSSWQETRMNLRTFARHGVFRATPTTWSRRIARHLLGEPAERHVLAEALAARLRDPEAIRRAKVFPYQLLMANRMADRSVPKVIVRALEQAMETAIENVPSFGGRVVVCPDVSGSMTWTPVTGHRKGATTQVRCIDVAALIASAVLRRNPDATVLPFDTEIRTARVDPSRGVLRNADRLAKLGGGGTRCSAPIAWLNANRSRPDLVILVSDCESWADPSQGRGTELMAQWARLRQRHPSAKLVCLDLQPYATVQAPDGGHVLNVGGFSDRVFDLIRDFAAGRLSAGHWVDVIEAIEV